MSYALDNVFHPLQISEDLIVEGIDAVVRHWQESATALGKLCAGPERWQAALRQIQTPLNLAEILRARTIL